MSTDVIMPQMGESIAEGTITKWLKKPGDAVKRDEPLFEISTDKVDAEIPSPAAGVLSEILVKEGQTVEINTVVGRIGAAGEKAAAAAPAAGAAAPAATDTTKSEPAAQQAQGGAVASAKAAAPPVQQAQTRQASAPAEAQPQSSAGAGDGDGDGARGAASREELRRTRSSPLVRKIAEEHGVNISALQGTGISGRVTKNDIISFIEQGGAATHAPGAQPSAASAAAAAQASRGAAPAAVTPEAPAWFSPGQDTRVEPMSTIRKKIAEHMVMSRRTSAHVTTFFEVDMSGIARLRARHKEDFQAREGISLTWLPFIAKAAIDAIRRFPIINSSVDGDKIVYKKHVHLGIAVALDWGLIVPVIKDADEKNILGLARAIADLGERARTKRLKPDDVVGGTFTITNPGGFGGLIGTPIINQPQVAIMGVGSIQKRAVVIDDAIAIRTMAMLALSFDHRIVDGADADRYMAAVKQTLEQAAFTDLGV